MIAIATDHNGYAMKEELKPLLEKEGIEYTDLGPDKLDLSDDYPVFAAKVSEMVSTGKAEYGVLICGTGIGMAICANKFKGVRAVNSSDTFCIERSRMHNNANVICLGASLIDTKEALDLIKTFITTDFEGGRHQKRIDMIKD